MIQGRFIRFAGGGGRVCLLVALAAWSARAGGQRVMGAEAGGGGLKLSWTDADHASGIYTVKSEARLTVLVDNSGDGALPLEGEIVFGTSEVSSGGAGERRNGAAEGTFKAISVTPLSPATIGPGQRAKIALTLPFAEAGTYELRWKSGRGMAAIENRTGAAGEGGVSLQCIFAPRRAANGRSASPWLAVLPAAAAHERGFLGDYMQQTSVRRFLIDERFTFDAAANVGLGFGASLGATGDEAKALFAEVAKARATLVLRVTVPMGAGGDGGAPDARTLAAFTTYVTDAARRSQGALEAIAIVPAAAAEGQGAAMPMEARHQAFRAFYFAAYQAAKAVDKNIFMLGAGSAADTFDLLLNAPAGGKEDLRGYLDAFGVINAAGEPGLARSMLAGREVPLWLLPPAPASPWPAAPAAAGLAQGCAVVPLPRPAVDRGVTAHLLGGATFAQRVRVLTPNANAGEPKENTLPFVGIFQGENYAVGAIAGLSAGTDADGALPTLARTRTEVEPVKADDSPAYPNLEVSDDTRSMRVVDGRGDPVECRVGDSVYVPAGDHVVYLLQAGTAEDLAASLRPATPNRLPLFEISASRSKEAIVLKLVNITTLELAGKVRLILANPAEGALPTALAEKELPALAPQKSVELSVDVPAGSLPADAAFVVEVTTGGAGNGPQKGQIQRTAVRIE